MSRWIARPLYISMLGLTAVCVFFMVPLKAVQAVVVTGWRVATAIVDEIGNSGDSRGR